MKKASLFLFVALLATSMVHAYDLRESVCIVEAQYSAEEEAQLGDFALWLSRKGFMSESRTLSAYKNGSTGSGVVIASDKGRYILTNRHVVGYAKDVNISFVLRDTTLRFEHCQVLAASQDADLALVRLPDTCAQPALLLAASAPEDGQDIVAAGFPGLGGKPSWQITKGAVSNSYLQIDHQKHPFVQHTAPIDPGSSGGPLLIQTDTGYLVLGINTMKAFWRDNVGIAIPTTTIHSFIAEDGSAPIDHAMLEEIAINGETWAKMMDKMDEACVDSLKKMNIEMPLDIIKHTLELACTPEVQIVAGKNDSSTGSNSKHNAKSGVYDANFGNYLYVRAEYINAFGRNQQINLAWENNRQVFVYGLGLSLMLDELRQTDQTIQLSPGFGIGFHLGAQVPLHMGKHYAIPRFVVAPYIAPMGFINSSKHVGGIPFSVGNDFAFSAGDYLICVGVHYVYDLSFYQGTSLLITNNNRKILSNGDFAALVGTNNLSISLAFGW